MTALLRRPATWLLAIAVAAIAAFMFVVVPNYRLYIIHTGSMTPTIPIGSAVLVDKGPVHVGEVITFHRLADGALVTHRLIAMKPDGTLVTKGDGNNAPDLGSIPRSNVVGHVVAAPQHVGSTLHFISHTPLGYLFDAVILVLMYLVLSVPSKKKARASGSHRAGPAGDAAVAAKRSGASHRARPAAPARPPGSARPAAPDRPGPPELVSAAAGRSDPGDPPPRSRPAAHRSDR